MSDRSASGNAAPSSAEPANSHRKERHPGCYAPRSMSSDLTSLVRRDHDDLDHMLLALTDPTTSAGEALALLESLQTAFGAHCVAQWTALRDVLGSAVAPRALSMIVQSILDEHRDQARVLAALAMAGPGTSTWKRLAAELRDQLVDHATREEFMRASLCDHVSAASQHALASTYAAERLRRLVTLESAPQAVTAVGVN